MMRKRSLCGTEGAYRVLLVGLRRMNTDNRTSGSGNTFAQHDIPLASPQSHPSRPSHTTPTAQDLLQNLMIDPKGYTSPVHNRPLPLSNIPRQSPLGPQPQPGQQSPGMLFGGDGKGSSIWTMTREESGRGQPRVPQNNVNIANIWGAPEPVQGVGVWQNVGNVGNVGHNGGVGNGMGQVGGTWGQSQWSGGQQYPR